MDYASSCLSSAHAAYLNLGGVDGFIGDGKIKYRPEQVIDLYYKPELLNFAWLTLDYQHIVNPAYNADRGPVDIYGVGRVLTNCQHKPIIQTRFCSFKRIIGRSGSF